PADEKAPDRVLYDKLVVADGPLFAGVDLSRLAKPRPKDAAFGLAKTRFGTQPGGPAADDSSLTGDSGRVIEVGLPAALFVGRECVADGGAGGGAGDRVVQFRVLPAPPGPDARWDAGPVAAARDGAAYRRLLDGYADFRRYFPLFLCFPQVVPNDEVVT